MPHEAALVLASALEKTGGRAQGQRQAVQEVRDFQDLVDAVSLNRHGDAIGTHFLCAVENGKFVIKGSLEPQGIAG